MKGGRICSDLKWIPVEQEGIEARSHLLRLLLWRLWNQQMTVSIFLKWLLQSTSFSLRLPKKHLPRLPGRKSCNLLCCTLDITFSSSIQFYLMTEKNLVFRCFGFLLTIMDISTRNGSGLSFHSGKHSTCFPYSESVEPDIRSNIYNTFKSVQNELQVQLSWHF